MRSRGYIRLLTVAALLAGLLLAAVLIVRFVIEGPRGKPPSVLFVVVDTVRADRVFGPQARMPFLAGLAKTGVAYTRARAVAEWTLPSHASLFTGKLPSEHGATFEHRMLPTEAATIAEVLGGDGFATAAFTANVNVSRLYGLDQGFDTFVEAWRTRAGTDRTLASDALIDELLAWWDATKQRPAFMFLNLMDAHLPYDASSAALAAAGPAASAIPREILAAPDFFDRVWAGELTLDAEFKRALAARYDAAVATADAKLARLVGELERRGFFEHGILIVTSDHGENLGEHGRVDHQGALDETLLRVPLVIVGERIPSGIERDEALPTTRLYSWLVDFANGATKLVEPTGKPIVAERFAAIEILERLSARFPNADRSALDRRETAVLTPDGTRKLVLAAGLAPRWFDVSGAVATERELDAAADAARIADLEAELERMRKLARPVREAFAPETDDPDEVRATWEQLAALGYVGRASAEPFSLHAQEHLARGNRSFAKLDYVGARADFEGATRLDPTFVDAWFNLALATERTDLASALPVWERYLALALKTGGQDPKSIEHAMERIKTLKP